MATVELMSSDPVPEPASTPKRDRLLDTANRLFYERGYHAVGIDAILAEAGLAKMTLYHHFPSKEELIAAALDRRGRLMGESVAAALDSAGGSARNRLKALFDWHERWFAGRDFNGCAFIRAAGEYMEPASPVHQAVVRQKDRSRRRIEAILREMGLARPETLARQIQLLLEGAIVMAQVHDDPTTIAQARDAALKLIKAEAKGVR